MQGEDKMSLHPGMAFKFTKGKAKGRIGHILVVSGNDVLVRTSKRRYWAKKHNLEDKIKFIGKTEVVIF